MKRNREKKFDYLGFIGAAFLFVAQCITFAVRLIGMISAYR